MKVFLQENLPLLGTVPALKKGNRDEDDDGLLAVASLDLEIPGVSIMPPSAHRLSQLSCSVCVYVSPDFKSPLLATKRVHPNAPSSFIGVVVCVAHLQRLQWQAQFFSSYLAGRDELQRTKSSLHLRHAGLQIVQSSCDLLLDLAGLSPGGRVGSDLVEGGGRHFGRVDIVVASRRGSVVKPKSCAKVVVCGGGVGGRHGAAD